MTNQEKLKDYDSEPIKYCAKCFSIKIQYEEITDSEYCADCGCSNIQEALVEDWEKLYEKKYGHKFAVKNDDPKKSIIFKMPLEKLKTKVYNSPFWREIIYTLYPKFPGGYGREDSILMVFDRLIKDSRLDDLRMLLLKYLRN